MTTDADELQRRGTDVDDASRPVVGLDEPAAVERAVSGGKAAMLARLRQAGFPVPDGFVVPVAATRQLLAGQDARPPEERPQGLREAIVAALARLGDGAVAVRSSAVAEDAASASWAGQFTTVLDVTGPEAVTAAVTAVLDSMAEELPTSYRECHSLDGTDGTQGMAVLVQRMVPADAAGVAFSANPVTGAREETLVHAVRGIGDRLVGGEVDPDEFVVRGDDIQVLARPEAAIDSARARDVAELAEDLEQLLGAPQDIEWAWGPDGLHLLQSRPITALPVPPADDLPPGTWLKDTAHYPEPLTPLARTYLDALEHGIEQGMCEHWGLLVERVEQRMVGGEVYGRVVPVGGTDGPPPPWWLLGVLARILPPMRRRLRAAADAVGSGELDELPRRWEHQLRPAFRERVTALRDVALRALDDGELLTHVDDTVTLLHDGQELHFRLFIPYAVALHELVTTTEELLGWDPARTMELLQGLSTASSAPSVALEELAELVASRPAARDAVRAAGADLFDRLDAADTDVAAGVRAHRDRWGLHTLNYDPGSPTLAERPELLAALLRDELDRVEAADRERLDTARRDARAAARRALRDAGVDASGRARFEESLARAERAYPVREDNLFWTDSTPNGLLRRAAIEIGRRLTRRGLLREHEEAVWLHLDELRAALRGAADHRTLGARIERRRAERRWVRANPGPDVRGPGPPPSPDVRGLPSPARRTNAALLWLMRSEGIVPADQAPETTADLVGSPASAGRHTGTVRVLRGEADFDKLHPGDVLVAPITAPAWSVLFARAGAVVTDAGGVLSHAAIVAREHGIPAVLSTGDATEQLRDGMTVTVDGRAGTVTNEEQPS